MRKNLFPGNDLLKKYISYISFSRTDTGKKAFLVFPNPGAAIALHRNHTFIQEDKNIFKTKDSPESVQLLHTNRIDPVKVIDEGEKETITIVFKPLGVNHFLKEDLSDLVKAAGGAHSYIDLSPYGFADFANQVFRLTGTENQLRYIEDFLRQLFIPMQIQLVEDAVRLLSDFEESLSIPEICKQVGTSPRNLSRLFNKYIVLSPVAFRNISRFRYSLNRKFESEQRALKEIGYESNYSDASYMIRMYKKYTGLNPSAFFKKVTVDSNYVFLSL